MRTTALVWLRRGVQSVFLLLFLYLFWRPRITPSTAWAAV